MTIYVDRQLDFVDAAEGGEVNGDGFDDLVLRGSTWTDGGLEYRILVYLQNACDGLNPPVTLPGEYAGKLVLANVTGDGRRDVIAGPLVFPQDRNGSLPTDPLFVSVGPPPGVGVMEVTAIDYNGDGIQELAYLQEHDVVLVPRHRGCDCDHAAARLAICAAGEG